MPKHSIDTPDDIARLIGQGIHDGFVLARHDHAKVGDRTGDPTFAQYMADPDRRAQLTWYIEPLAEQCPPIREFDEVLIARAFYAATFERAYVRWVEECDEPEGERRAEAQVWAEMTQTTPTAEIFERVQTLRSPRAWLGTFRVDGVQ